MPLRDFVTLRPVNSTASSAMTYVPAVLLSRALAFLRTLAVAWILARVWHSRDPTVAQSAFGAYQTALEFTNLLTPVVVLGASDVAERYLARTVQEQGPGSAHRWVRRHLARLAMRAFVLAAVLLLASPWVVRGVWGTPAFSILVASVATIVVLAAYQFLAAALRALRAYAAAAGMELFSGVLLLILSAAGATLGHAHALMWAYAVSLALPLALYGTLLARHLGPSSDDSATTATPSPSTRVYAAWTVARWFMVTLFGFLCIWGVRHVSQPSPGQADTGLIDAGVFALPFRIAQLLGFIGITLWSSAFAIAARSWLQGRRRQASVQLLRVGRYGAAAFVIIAAGVLVARPLLVLALPAAYEAAVISLLPGMLAIFIWHSLLSLLAVYCDLRESPHHGTILWAAAVAVLMTAIAAAPFLPGISNDPKGYMLYACALATALPLLLVGPFILQRPPSPRRAVTPLAVLAVASATLMAPVQVVDYIAPPALLLALFALYMANLLPRPADRRAFHRWRAARRRSRPLPAVG